MDTHELDLGDDLLNSSRASDDQLNEFDELVEAADALLTSNGRRPSTVASIMGAGDRFSGFGIDTIAEEAENTTDSNGASPTAGVQQQMRGDGGTFKGQPSANAHTYSFTSSGAGIYSTKAPTAQIGKLRLTEAQAKLYGIYDYETNTIKIPKPEGRATASRSKVEELSKPKAIPKAPPEKRQTSSKCASKRRNNEYNEKTQNRPSVADTAIETHRASQLRLEYMREEEEYNARGKKKVCESCRKEQTFSEVHQRIKMCRACQAPFVAKTAFNLRRWEDRQHRTMRAKDSAASVSGSSVNHNATTPI